MFSTLLRSFWWLNECSTLSINRDIELQSLRKLMILRSKLWNLPIAMEYIESAGEGRRFRCYHRRHICSRACGLLLLVGRWAAGTEQHFQLAEATRVEKKVSSSLRRGSFLRSRFSSMGARPWILN